MGICKDHLNYITMADCKHFRGDAIDLETFSGNIISGIVSAKKWIFGKFSLMAKHPTPMLIIFFVWGKIPFSLQWLPFNFIHHHDNRTEKKMIALPECEKTEETLMTSWYPAVTAVFNDKTITKVLPKHQFIITIMTKSKGLKGERLRSFYSCVSALLSIQVSNTFPLYWR